MNKYTREDMCTRPTNLQLWRENIPILHTGGAHRVMFCATSTNCSNELFERIVRTNCSNESFERITWNIKNKFLIHDWHLTCRTMLDTFPSWSLPSLPSSRSCFPPYNQCSAQYCTGAVLTGIKIDELFKTKTWLCIIIILPYFVVQYQVFAVQILDAFWKIMGFGPALRVLMGLTNLCIVAFIWDAWKFHFSVDKKM